MSGRPVSDLTKVETGDIVRHRDGSLWLVLGFNDQPTVILRREGTESLRPTEHTQLSIIPTSAWAWEWERWMPAGRDQMIAELTLLVDQARRAMPHDADAEADPYSFVNRARRAVLGARHHLATREMA